MKKVTTFMVLFLSIILSAEAFATVYYRMPLSMGHVPTYWFDHDSRSGYFLRYDGNTTNRYDGHYGTDFNGSSGNGIWAGANGTVAYTKDNCPDYPVEDCGSGFGNNVRLQHVDGKVSVYAHMKKGSVNVNLNQSVLCAALLGNVGNSGNSTGAHLHFETRNSVYGYSSSVAFDPFGGPYSGYSYWVNQNGGNPTTQCQ